jgi:hypothetical protein
MSRRVFIAHTGRDCIEVLGHDAGRHIATLPGFPGVAVAEDGQILVTNRGAAAPASRSRRASTIGRSQKQRAKEKSRRGLRLRCVESPAWAPGQSLPGSHVRCCRERGIRQIAISVKCHRQTSPRLTLPRSTAVMDVAFGGTVNDADTVAKNVSIFFSAT